MNLNHSAMNYNLGAGASVAQRSLFEPELGRVC